MLLLLFLCLLVSEATEARIRHDVFDHFHPLHQNGTRSFIDRIRPKAVDPVLDCMIREYAYTYAQFLQPERGSFRSVFDALQLATLCNQTAPKEVLGTADKWTRKSKFPRATATQIYVDANNGADTNSGTQSSPLKTIAAAVRLSRANGGGGNIILRAGTFYLTETIVLNSIDSGLFFTNYPGEQVTVSGGINVNFLWKGPTDASRVFQNTNFVSGRPPAPGQSVPGIQYAGQATSSNDCAGICGKTFPCPAWTWFSSFAGAFANMCYLVLDGQVPMVHDLAAVSGQNIQLYTTDFSSVDTYPDQLFINGKRQIRARHPNADPETSGIHTNPSGYFPNAKSWGPTVPYDGFYEVHVASPSFPTSLSPTFPNFSAGLDGPVQAFNPPFSYWGTQNPHGGAAATYTISTGLTYDPTTFPAPPANAVGGIVHAFHCNYWGNWQFKVDSFNAATSTLGWSRGGFQEARGCVNGSTWYLENVKELLDFPGEWFYENSTSLLYYYVNSTTDLPKSGVVPALTTLFSITGTAKNPVRNVGFNGITFAHSRQTFLEDYEVPSAGDWSAHRGGAVYVEGTVNTTVENCLFTGLGGNGLMISFYNRNVTISGNEFTLTGDSAIVQLGRATGIAAGLDGQYPQATHIVGNLAHDIGMWGKQIGALYQAIAPETLVEKNVFFNGPRAAVNFNDGFGGGYTVQDNLVLNMVRETADHGHINTWDRQPYITKFGGGEYSLYPKSNLCTRNFLINGYNSAWPIDHDDGSAYYTDYSNALIYGGAKNYLGHDQLWSNNLYVDPEASVWGGSRLLNLYAVPINERWLGNTAASSISTDDELYNLYGCDPNDLTSYLLTSNNSYYYPSKTVRISCGDMDYTLEQWQAVGQDLGSVSYGPATNDQIMAWIKEKINGP